MTRHENLRVNLASERGGALILVLVSIILLSVTGISMFRQSQTEYAMARNFFDDKVGLLIADSGINYGINEIRKSVNPYGASFDSSTDTLFQSSTLIQVEGKDTFTSVVRSGHIENTETSAQEVKGLSDFIAPWPPGVDISSGSGMVPTAWDLTVTARVRMGDSDTRNKIRAVKEIQNGLVVLSPNH